MKVLSFLGGALAWVASQAGLLAVLPHTVQVVIGGLGAVLAAIGIRQATPVNPLTALLDRLGSGWKTYAGVAAAILGALLAPDVLAILPAGTAHFLQGAGEFLAALGLYHAQAAAVNQG